MGRDGQARGPRSAGASAVNGEQFHAKPDQVIELPARRADRSNLEFLKWHLGVVFKVS
jgi:hypothetical protein